MEVFRIVNLTMQSLYLALHLGFIIMLYRRRQHTPIWSWFFILSIMLWLWVSGRWMESIVYLFYPGHNDAYVFAANYQYIGNTNGGVAYLIWILYLAGYDRLASNKWFRAFLFACPALTCTLVFTNPLHQLFYTKLVMGERVAHGPMFVPCVLWSFLILMAGYAVSIVYIFKTGHDRVRQGLMFSIFPLLPLIALIARSASGVDLIDYTPAVMAVAIWSLYRIIFKYHYINIIPASIEAVMEQTEHPIGIWNPLSKEQLYVNRAARQGYEAAATAFLPKLRAGQSVIEGVFDGKALTVSAAPLAGRNELLIAVTDHSELSRQQRLLERQIAELEAQHRALEEVGRNIDAYLGALTSTEELKSRQQLIDDTYKTIRSVFKRAADNLNTAKQNPSAADTALQENLRLTRKCIALIRKAVAQLGRDHYA